jgi:hypothetical protein
MCILSVLDPKVRFIVHPAAFLSDPPKLRLFPSGAKSPHGPTQPHPPRDAQRRRRWWEARHVRKVRDSAHCPRQGTKPATNPGAMTRKTAEPTIVNTCLITSSCKQVAYPVLIRSGCAHARDAFDDDEACARDAHTARCAARGAGGHHSTTSVAGARRGAPGRDLWAFAGNSQPDIRAANWGETGGTPHVME